MLIIICFVNVKVVIVIWDGDVGDGLWGIVINWDGDVLFGVVDDVWIENGDVVILVSGIVIIYLFFISGLFDLVINLGVILIVNKIINLGLGDVIFIDGLFELFNVGVLNVVGGFNEIYVNIFILINFSGG